MSATHLYSGKVRDVFDVGDGLLLMVASDRISAFDVVFSEPVPDKGRVLTAMTAHFTALLAGVAPTHLVTADPAQFPVRLDDLPETFTRGVLGSGTGTAGGPYDLAGRSMLVRRAEMLPIECIVRGYLSGSAWKEYLATGTMHGTELPVGLLESARLAEPAFTPSTKALEGHDVNISYLEAANLVGSDAAERAREITLGAYRLGAAAALERGIVIADTKFELGYIDGELAICDEILTPDSSRFWPADEVAPGSSPPSFDKQPVRDWAESTGWDKAPPPPRLPAEVIAATRARYVAAYEQITGTSIDDWYGSSP